jgi:hypothetical protein
MGFTQEANIRHFHFQRVLPRARPTSPSPIVRFTMNADMALFVKYRIPVQEGPALCLQILTETMAAADEDSAKPASYAVTLEHFNNFALARTKDQEAKLARRKPRPPFKPTGASQLKWPRVN